MRLIDADNFLERFEKMCETETDNIIATILRGALINEPTAYSVDKVVEELETDPSVKLYGSGNSNNYLIPVDRAIKIVKEGIKND